MRKLSKNAARVLALTVMSSVLFSNYASAAGSVRFTSGETVNSKFDRQAAKEYAVKYAAKYGNNSYYNFGGHGGGGDCTNFASQVLFAGGLPKVGTSGSYISADDKNNSWFYYSANRPYRSISWTGAHEFRHYWGNVNGVGGQHAYQMKVYDMKTVLNDFPEIYRDLWEGDIVQYVGSDGITYHTQVVHGYANGDLKVAQHSVNELVWASGIPLKESIASRIEFGGWFVTIKMKY